MNGRIRFLTQSALCAALICILAPLAIPVGPVPVTLGIFAVLFCAQILDWKCACAAVGVYLLMGLIGLPVFSAGKGGIGVLLGPTGGYLWTYLPMAAISGWLAAQIYRNDRAKMVWLFLACVPSLLICYICGTLQFMAVGEVSLQAALASCVYPFVVFDLMKCWAAVFLGKRIRRRLEIK